MASKKGIVITAIILASITAVSFLFWLLPQENPTILVISDYENYLDGERKIYSILQESIEIEFQNLLDQETSPDEYISTADITSSQITSQISEFVTSKPPEQWQNSYISFMEALKKFNAYVVETKVAANMIKNDNLDIKTIQKIELLKSESYELILKSDELRPK